MKTTISYYNAEIEINRRRQIQPSELQAMPYYVFRMYFESVQQELRDKKKANDEQQREHNKRKFKGNKGKR